MNYQNTPKNSDKKYYRTFCHRSGLVKKPLLFFTRKKVFPERFDDVFKPTGFKDTVVRIYCGVS